MASDCAKVTQWVIIVSGIGRGQKGGGVVKPP